MTMETLKGLGWEWRQNGVVLCVQLSGQKPQQVFVPLNRVWHEFHQELAAVGCPLPASVGDEITVSGLFSSIKHAVKSVAHSVTHNAVTKAAAKVATTATNYAAHALNAVPVVGPLATSVTRLMTAPLGVAEALAKGGRIDRVAMAQLKSQLKDVKAVAPYAQTVLSVVPGVGQGLSGAIGAGLSLASGQSLTDALAAGVRGALPGGPLAAAAFDVATAAMQGKSIDQIALNALPISPQQKQALVVGLKAAKDLAAGKNVAQTAIDAATHALPADVLKAVQIGAALGHARNLQSAVGTLGAAAKLSATYATGLQAAKEIKSLPLHAPVPPALTSAVKQGLAAHAATKQAIAHASAGHPQAAQLVSALKLHAQSAPHAPVAAPRPVAATGHRVRPRYHSTPAPASVGALWSPLARARAVHVPRLTSPIALAFKNQAHAHAAAAHAFPSFMAPRHGIFR